MSVEKFISIGENIHCTRVCKVGGKYVKEISPDKYVIRRSAGDGAVELPVPERFTSDADWAAGKVKHCAAAVWQGFYGEGKGKEAGVRYLREIAAAEEKNGANYLDLNVDEFSTDVDERVKLMKWLAGTVREASKLPLSIDSSNMDILRAGLEECDPSRGRPLLNSVSLERFDVIGLASEFRAGVIASAAGKNDLPSTCEGRVQNLDQLMPELKSAGIAEEDIYIDPLVFPISTDSGNGVSFLESLKKIRERFGQAVHISGGLSNVSFGMPKRSLINLVFTRMCLDAGADGGIVDPVQVNLEALNSLDTGSKSFRVTADLLNGEDDFGMNFIAAARNGEI
ncbi:MAG: dihydropteroate synthase [Kiritimatiellia bacterium]